MLGAMGDQTKQRAVYAFLRERACSGVTFTAKGIDAAMGWRGTTGATYKALDELFYRDTLDRRIGGFFISHVSGRFRTGPIVSRRDSAAKLASDKAYLIDETTAVVRFIIP
jgi:hypothetical protein